MITFRACSRWLALAVLAAGAAGAAATLAGASFPLRGLLVLLFLVAAPAIAVARLFTTLDMAARALVAAVSALVIDLLTAEILLAAGLWSPRRTLLSVVIVTALLAAAAGVSQATRRQAERGLSRTSGN